MQAKTGAVAPTPRLLHVVPQVTFNFMTEVTRILNAIDQGDPHAAGQLLPLVYDELRKLTATKMAQEAPGQTLQATALVHEAYLRLVDKDDAQHWDSRGHFFAAAAEAMRRILVEIARRKDRVKHGGKAVRQIVDLDRLGAGAPDDDLLDLHDALEKLAAHDIVKAKLVELRCFTGLTLPQAAALLGISPSTADRAWRFARAWLYASMADNS
ncbi:MAG TPA: ECF-type sigma factor [Gemmataceae bacterium]|nr:ECF-type sigma factor [Gemmataceae bacterium]